MQVALRGYKWVLTEVDTNSRLGFAYPVVDANTQSTIKELEPIGNVSIQTTESHFFRARITLYRL